MTERDFDLITKTVIIMIGLYVIIGNIVSGVQANRQVDRDVQIECQHRAISYPYKYASIGRFD